MYYTSSMITVTEAQCVFDKIWSTR